jgi:hypothetical protein
MLGEWYGPREQLNLSPTLTRLEVGDFALSLADLCAALPSGLLELDLRLSSLAHASLRELHLPPNLRKLYLHGVRLRRSLLV